MDSRRSGAKGQHMQQTQTARDRSTSPAGAPHEYRTVGGRIRTKQADPDRHRGGREACTYHR